MIQKMLQDDDVALATFANLGIFLPMRTLSSRIS
jgi:hypothetical protein